MNEGAVMKTRTYGEFWGILRGQSGETNVNTFAKLQLYECINGNGDTSQGRAGGRRE